MGDPKRWLVLAAGLVAALVATASIVQAVRSGSWGPVISVGWIPAVVVAVWPGAHRCRPPRRRAPERVR